MEVVQWTVFALYLFYAFWLERLAWVHGVHAIRWVDQDWNEHQGLLRPYYFYLLGWAKDKPYPKEKGKSKSTKRVRDDDAEDGTEDLDEESEFFATF